jgi:type IV secretion system protein VirB10
MSGPPPDPNRSPTFLPPARTGIRRLNNRVLHGVGVVIILASFAFAYTIVKRMTPVPVTAANEDTKPKPQGGNGSDLDGVFDRKVKGSSISTRPTATPAKTDTPASSPGPVTDTSKGEDMMEQARADAWKRYFQDAEEVRRAKFEAEKSAMESDGGLELPSGKAPSGQDAGTGNMPTASALAMAGSSGLPDMPGPPGYGGSAGIFGGGTDKAAQAEKQRFLNQGGDLAGVNEDVMAVKHNAKPDTLMAGTAIPGVTLIESNSDMPGMVKGLVRSNVYDTMTGNDILIPQGSTLIGIADNNVSAGQERAGVIWNRIIFPDTSSIQIGSMEGADAAGAPGAHDIVNTHFWDKFLSATIISVSGAAAQLAQPQQSAYSGYNPASVAAGSLTQQYSQLGTNIAQAGLSVPNTLTIRPGYLINVMINKDLHLPPYVDQRGDQSAGMFGPVYR